MLDGDARCRIDRCAKAADADGFALEIFRFLNRRTDTRLVNKRSLIKAMLNTSAPPMAALAVVLPAMARNSISPAIIAAIPSVPLGKAMRSISIPYFLNKPASRAAQSGVILPESEA
jgi:hypothetical protein